MHRSGLCSCAPIRSRGATVTPFRHVAGNGPLQAREPAEAGRGRAGFSFSYPSFSYCVRRFVPLGESYSPRNTRGVIPWNALVSPRSLTPSCLTPPQRSPGAKLPSGLLAAQSQARNAWARSSRSLGKRRGIKRRLCLYSIGRSVRSPPGSVWHC